jgi:hypothetical protein
MATKKFSWKEHKSWISEFADAVIVYPDKKNNKKKEKKNDTKSTSKNTKHNR